MRRLPLVAVAVVTVVCVVGVAILAVAAGGSALAYEVNGSRVSQSTVDGQLDDLANNDIAKSASHSDGSIDSTLVARLLTISIQRDLLRDVAERRGVKVTDEDRTNALAQLQQQVQDFEKTPASYRELVIDLQAHVVALGMTDDAVNALLTREYKRADVYVNPKYGFWNPRFGVCPPTGCASLNTGTGG